jgi:hypothetical protein
VKIPTGCAPISGAPEVSGQNLWGVTPWPGDKWQLSVGKSGRNEPDLSCPDREIDFAGGWVYDVRQPLSLVIRKT